MVICDRCEKLNKYIGSVLRKERLQQKKTAKQLSKALMFSPQFICDIEQGKRSINNIIFNKFINYLNLYVSKDGKIFNVIGEQIYPKKSI